MAAQEAKQQKSPRGLSPIEPIQCFAVLGGSANVTCSCKLILKSVASGIGSWGISCELGGRQRFPPSEDAASARPPSFPAERTSQQYLPRLGKDYVVVGYSFERKSKAVARAARGVAKAGGRIHEPKPAATRSLLVKIAGWNPLPGNSGQLDIHSPCAFGVPPISRAAAAWGNG